MLETILSGGKEENPVDPSRRDFLKTMGLVGLVGLGSYVGLDLVTPRKAEARGYDNWNVDTYSSIVPVLYAFDLFDFEKELVFDYGNFTGGLPVPINKITKKDNELIFDYGNNSGSLPVPINKITRQGQELIFDYGNNSGSLPVPIHKITRQGQELIFDYGNNSGSLPVPIHSIRLK